MGAGQDISMYSKSWCPYCAAARTLLAEKGVAVREIDIEKDPGLREEMIARSGRRTVPQIFIGATHIGGFDDLSTLDRAGRLDSMLDPAMIRQFKAGKQDGGA